VLAVAVLEKFQLFQFDMKMAFLNGALQEDVQMLLTMAAVRCANSSAAYMPSKAPRC
jgi:hypothetical protein